MIVFTKCLSRRSVKEIWKNYFAAWRHYSSTPLILPEVKAGNGLHRFLLQKLRVTGPVTVEEFMKLGLSAPKPLGYYSDATAEGVFSSRKGDFYTSPQISQFVGELLGVWIYFNVTEAMGHVNRPWRITELGPGTGELMLDMLTTLKQLKSKNGNIDFPSVNLVEIAHSLIDSQAEKLLAVPKFGKPKPVDLGRTYSGNFGTDFTWFDSMKDTLTAANEPPFSIFVAHEFFDALPIHKFRRTDKGWREILVDLDMARPGKLRFVASPTKTVAQNAYLSDKLCEELSGGQPDLEISPESAVQIGQICDHLNQHGGCALIVDYGHNGDVSGDTFRAFSQHRLTDPLEDIGKCDLTADVNFRFLRQIAAQKCYTVGPVTQADFLHNMGLKQRFEQLLAKSETDSTRDYLTRCYDVLTSDTEMGTRFKVFAIFPKVMGRYFDQYAPVGFSAIS